MPQGFTLLFTHRDLPVQPTPTVTVAWKRFSAALSLDSAMAAPLLARLSRAYQTGDRHYHTLEHVIDCLSTLSSYPSPPSPLSIELALWYHDAIYDPNRSDNEAQSALFMESEFAAAELDPQILGQAKALVLATSHKETASNEAEAIIADVDMAILATPPARYLQYTQQIRKEYSCFDDASYRVGRSTFLKTFLSQSQIFQTAHYRDMFENRARINMGEELKRLKAKDSD
ncbi:hypothetical protein IEN85_04840 [Pelagicoccus sp. NFK12]|uniref:Metal-dependent HD superfamily phosphohydrolase n=1 Tax=Pelagicoccus enzymogenes TaxID=2773457 RepID=A0A927F5Y5_9BACT|nr:hypothetical protein [Pelagicoccus enzymogenes]MBD5778807.1 hypothetical protein [Pelagicoccus enzymogenes]